MSWLITGQTKAQGIYFHVSYKNAQIYFTSWIWFELFNAYHLSSLLSVRITNDLWVMTVTSEMLPLTNKQRMILMKVSYQASFKSIVKVFRFAEVWYFLTSNSSFVDENLNGDCVLFTLEQGISDRRCLLPLVLTFVAFLFSQHLS